MHVDASLNERIRKKRRNEWMNKLTNETKENLIGFLLYYKNVDLLRHFGSNSVRASVSTVHLRSVAMFRHVLH